MKLKDFVGTFICANSLMKLWVRLPKEEGYGHRLLVENDKTCCMDWELLKSEVWQSKYNNCEVVGVNDIACDDFYREAINIVIALA